MPLPNTAVFGSGWSQHHQPTATSAMTAKGTITRPSETAGEWNPTTGDVATPPPELIYTGPMRVQAKTTDPVDRDATGQQVTTREYLIAITVDSVPIRAGEHGDRVTITECDADPGLIGRVLRVTDAAFGSESFQRDLTCVDDLTANNP